MDKNLLNNGDKKADRDNTGKFVKGKEGGPGRPEGSTNKFSIAKLEEAIAAEEEYAAIENAPGIFQMFVRMAYMNPNVMIALMKKFVPDMQHTEISGIEPLKFEVEILNGNKKPESK